MNANTRAVKPRKLPCTTCPNDNEEEITLANHQLDPETDIESEPESDCSSDSSNTYEELKTEIRDVHAKLNTLI